MLKLENYRINNPEEGAYIPILDREPEFAAKFLTKVDLDAAYKLLTSVFKEIKEENYIHTIMVDTVLDTKDNFLWYSSFLYALENALGVEPEDSFEIPMEKCPENREIKKRVRYQPPFRVDKGRKYWKANYVTNFAHVDDPIKAYRVQYILLEYDIEDFQDEVFPAWYVLNETTIFEQYNERTNTRVKVTFNGGEFRYFIAGASDNWAEVVDVPLEMDHIISALILRNYRLMNI